MIAVMMIASVGRTYDRRAKMLDFPCFNGRHSLIASPLSTSLFRFMSPFRGHCSAVGACRRDIWFKAHALQCPQRAHVKRSPTASFAVCLHTRLRGNSHPRQGAARINLSPVRQALSDCSASGSAPDAVPTALSQCHTGYANSDCTGSRGVAAGATIPSNLAPACLSSNCNKGTKDIERGFGTSPAILARVRAH